ncbi:hypothetical protein Taro_019798 [Colocasia esculenta]|uniref:Uncharacterized protein n=1 Tax=Colocasia esculenta TaxID=4460 RepID=A0A843UX93_COLES|nr:hypothetical protein [Colocasia esculenta]
MEAARRGLVAQPSPLPPSTSHVPRAHLRKTTFSSCSAFHGQASQAVSSTPITSVVRHFPASILLQEQRDNLRHYPVKDDKIPQVTLDRICMETEESASQDEDDEFGEYLKHFERQFLYSPGSWYPLPKHTEEKTSLPESINFIISDTYIESESEEQYVVKDCVNGVLSAEVLALAKEAVLASQEAAILAESYSMTAHIHGFRLGSGPKNSAAEHIRVEEATVKSKRFLERRSKRRRMPKKATTVINNSAARSVSTEMSKKISKGLDANDPLRLFLWGPETKQLLTVKEERDLFNKIQAHIFLNFLRIKFYC